jgi:PAS domain S-box-containing protein
MIDYFMDLREKTLVGLVTIFSVVTIILIILSQTIFLDSYRTIESKDMSDDIEQILANIQDEFTNLESSTSDWGPWDDTYEFARGNNPAYITDNLQHNTYESLHLNFIVITDTSGTILYSQSYNFTDSSFHPLAADLAREIAGDSSSLRPVNAEKTSGFIVLSNTTAIAASNPILHNDLTGPPAGTLIMGRYVDDAEIRSFGLQSESLPLISPVTPSSVSSAGTPTEIRKPIVQVNPVSEEIIEGKTTLRDINGKDALVLTFKKHRDFYLQGKQTIQFFVFVQFAIMLLLVFFIVYSIDRSILTRLNSIINDTRAVSEGSALRIRETGNDEIAQLAEAMNQMLDQLEQSHANLRDSEEKFRSFVQESTDGYILLNSRGEVIEWNTANEVITGIPRNEAIGSPFIEIQIRLLVPEHRTPQYIERMRQASMSIVNTGEFSRFYESMEIGIIRPDGTRRTLQQVSFPIRISGELHFGLINRDITENRQVEEALQQSRRKLNLLNTVTFQDIRNTIFALSGYHVLVEKHITSPAGKEILIKEDQLLKQIDDTLNVAKNYQDLGLNPPRWQDVNQVFLFALSHLNTLNIKRTVRLDGLEIFADPLLEKVFFNLLEYAQQQGGNITAITLSYQKTETGLLLILEDNGRGISAKEKEKIFEREFREGLGLFLVREILSITGMTIQETGIEGEGTRFTIIVPEVLYRFSHDRP